MFQFVILFPFRAPSGRLMQAITRLQQSNMLQRKFTDSVIKLIFFSFLKVKIISRFTKSNITDNLEQTTVTKKSVIQPSLGSLMSTKPVLLLSASYYMSCISDTCAPQCGSSPQTFLHSHCRGSKPSYLYKFEASL